MFVPAGTRLTWVGDFSGTDFLWSTISDREKNVAAQLKNSYNLDVESCSDNYGTIYSSQFSITAHLLTNIDRNSDDDIRGNVQDAFTNEGATPVGARITSYTLPKNSPHSGNSPVGVPQQTGAPPADNTSDTPGTHDECSFWQRLTGDTSSCLVKADDFTWSKFGSGATGLIIGAVATIGLVIFLVVREA